MQTLRGYRRRNGRDRSLQIIVGADIIRPQKSTPVSVTETGVLLYYQLSLFVTASVTPAFSSASQ